MKLLYFYAFLLLGAFVIESLAASDFSFRRGHCETSVFSVVKEVVRKEVKALLNPSLRYFGSLRIHYDLYTPQNTNERQILRTGDVRSLRNSNFNPKWPVRFSIHGWAGKSISCSNAAIKDAYLDTGNFNVILVDWSDIALDISYTRISQQFSEIAAHIAKFIRFLRKETNVEMNNIYLIGHSAGGHISGLAGKLLKPQTLGAIVALDPAGLAQLGLTADFRLAPEDALYVESIHTDISHLGNPSVELSHASFFPNWGQGQPQCPNATAAEFDFACDHFASLYYFAMSIRHPYLFGAIRCPNVASIKYHNCSCSSGADECDADGYMGGEPVKPKTGIFYLSTKRNLPYGLENTVRISKVRRANFLESSYFSPQLLHGVYQGTRRLLT